MELMSRMSLRGVLLFGNLAFMLGNAWYWMHSGSMWSLLLAMVGLAASVVLAWRWSEVED